MAVKFTTYLDKVVAQIEATNKRNIRDATMTLFRAVQRKFTGPRSGEMYPIPGGGGGEYRASAPGEAPAKRTGALAASIRYDVSDKVGRVGTDNKYASHLEFGTATMEPREFLKPAVLDAESEIKRIMGRS